MNNKEIYQSKIFTTTQQNLNLGIEGGEKIQPVAIDLSTVMAAYKSYHEEHNADGINIHLIGGLDFFIIDSYEKFVSHWENFKLNQLNTK